MVPCHGYRDEIIRFVELDVHAHQAFGRGHQPHVGLGHDAEVRLHEHLVGLVESELIEAALAQTGGNQLRAAAMLGINRNTLRLKRSARDEMTDRS